MKLIRLNACIVTLAFLLAFAADNVSAKDKWINITTKNFNIVSSASEADTRQLALRLEQFHYVFTGLFGLKNVTTVPLTVIVFNNDGGFTPFKPLYNGKPTNVAGYFQGGDDENLIALNNTANERHPMALIYHEYTHLLTSKTQRDWPLWLREGIAELYSTFDVDNKDVTLGKPISSHVYLLRESKLIPLQVLFGVSHDHPAYNERDKQGIFYAQSWALTHYLMFGEKGARQPQMVEFVRLIYGGMQPDSAFTEAFKTDFATVEKELRRYVGNKSYSGTIYTLNSTEGEKELSVRPLGEAEVQFHLGNLLFRTDRLDEAETYFKQAAALDPALARASEGLGFLAVRRKQYGEALKHFERAISLGSKNHLVYYYYAETLEDQASGDMTPESWAKMADALKTSIKLMPGFEHSYYLLAFTHLASGKDLKEGSEMIKMAMRLAPQKKHYVLTLAQLQMRMDDYAAAKKTLEPLRAADADPQMRASAESLAKIIEYNTGSSPSAPKSNWDTDKEAPSESKTEPQPQQADEPKTYQVRGFPTLQIAGTQVIKGVLVKIECAGAKWTLVVNTSDKLMRFAVTDREKLEFYSQDPTFDGTVNCGSIVKVAFVYFKPMPASQSKFDGDAVAVEFTR